MDRREQILVAVAAADPALPAARVAAAVDAVATNPAATRELSAALVADPHAPTCSTYTRPPPSAGSATPAVTGTNTQHN